VEARAGPWHARRRGARPMPKPHRSQIKRWTEKDARAALAEFAQSGKPVTVFARERGLTVQRLYWWRRRLAGGEGITFQEIAVGQTGSVGNADSGAFEIEIVLRGGAIVRLRRGFDSVALAKVLEVLS